MSLVFLYATKLIYFILLVSAIGLHLIDLLIFALIPFLYIRVLGRLLDAGMASWDYARAGLLCLLTSGIVLSVQYLTRLVDSWRPIVSVGFTALIFTVYMLCFFFSVKLTLRRQPITVRLNKYDLLLYLALLALRIAFSYLSSPAMNSGRYLYVAAGSIVSVCLCIPFITLAAYWILKYSTPKIE